MKTPARLLAAAVLAIAAACATQRAAVGDDPSAQASPSSSADGGNAGAGAGSSSTPNGPDGGEIGDAGAPAGPIDGGVTQSDATAGAAAATAPGAASQGAGAEAAESAASRAGEASGARGGSASGAGAASGSGGSAGSGTSAASRSTASTDAAASPGAGAEAAGSKGEAGMKALESGDEESNEDAAPEGLSSRASGRPDHPRTLAEIVASGYIRVLTRNNDTSFFIYRGHRMGFDYELGKRLAQRLGIRVDMVITSDWNEMVPALLRGDGDVIAAQVTITPERKEQVLFASPWGHTREVVVYKDGATPITKIDDLAGKEVHVRTGSTYEASLKAQNARFQAAGKPVAKLEPLPGDLETDTILEKLSKGELLYTVADENLADIHASFYDNIVKGPAVSQDLDLAWAVRKGDEKLRAEIDAMLRDLKKKPDFNILKRKYFEARHDFKKERKDKFYASETGTLSPYDPLIIKYSAQHGFDWRLVAAQLYQESRFDKTRKSWVGAQGLFQIMPATARGLGISDPTDPEQSIRGGLKYMQQLNDHYTEIADTVERYRFAMAAYNSGFGHLDDARRLARAAGEDANKWHTVAKWLLRLSKREYFQKTRFGFCRGTEPVDYVRHIDERYAGYAQLVPLKKPEEASNR